MKRCPFCAEDIQDAAVKCRYCGEFLNDQRPAIAGGGRNRGLAIVLSVLLPGAGSLYRGEIATGLGFLFACCALYGIGAFIVSDSMGPSSAAPGHALIIFGVMLHLASLFFAGASLSARQQLPSS